MPRILLLILNAFAFGFLLYGLVRIYQFEMPGMRKNIKLFAGIILLLAPVAIIAGLFRPTPVYMLIYPLGIGAFVFLARLQ